MSIQTVPCSRGPLMKLRYLWIDRLRSMRQRQFFCWVVGQNHSDTSKREQSQGREAFGSPRLSGIPDRVSKGLRHRQLWRCTERDPRIQSVRFTTGSVSSEHESQGVYLQETTGLYPINCN